jgi:hypothetical protein
MKSGDFQLVEMRRLELPTNYPTRSCDVAALLPCRSVVRAGVVPSAAAKGTLGIGRTFAEQAMGFAVTPTIAERGPE